MMELVNSVLQQQLPGPRAEGRNGDHPGVHLAAQRGHSADREQTVARPEHLVEKRFGIPEVNASDACEHGLLSHVVHNSQNGWAAMPTTGPGHGPRSWCARVNVR